MTMKRAARAGALLVLELLDDLPGPRRSGHSIQKNNIQAKKTSIDHITSPTA